MLIGDRLRQLRKNAGLTANALAKMAGVAQSTISEVEAGKYAPKVDFLEKLCTALGITLSEFFREEVETHQYSPGILKLIDRASSLNSDDINFLIALASRLSK